MMRYFYYILLLIPVSGVAQFNNQVSLNASVNQFELCYSYEYKKLPVVSDLYIGLGNQDIDAGYNDFILGARFGLFLVKSEKNEVDVKINAGGYIPNNDYYKAPTPVYGFILGYNRNLGKSNKHALKLNVGYLYGKRNYLQKYENELVFVATGSQFKVSPFYFTVGYGFNF